MKKYNEKQKKENTQNNIDIFSKLLQELEECQNKRKSINEKIFFIDKKIKKLAILHVELNQPIINPEYNKYIEMFNDITKKKIDENSSNLNYEIVNFEQNKYINNFFPIYSRFINAYNKSQHKELRVVYHGTSENNIDNILRCGLDPKRRRGQACGPGEYFGNVLDISVGYSKGDPYVMIFIILMDSDGITYNDRGVLVINKSEYQLPIGYIKFHKKLISVSTPTNYNFSPLNYQYGPILKN